MVKHRETKETATSIIFIYQTVHEKVCDAKTCYCEDVKDLTLNVFLRNLPKLSQGPNRPDKAETKEDLGMKSRKIRPFGVMG